MLETCVWETSTLCCVLQHSQVACVCLSGWGLHSSKWRCYAAASATVLRMAVTHCKAADMVVGCLAPVVMCLEPTLLSCFAVICVSYVCVRAHS